MKTKEQPIMSFEEDELRFFDLVSPAIEAAIEALVTEAKAAGRTPTVDEIHRVMDGALHTVAGDALREIFGADIAAEFYDGKKPQ